jgi:ABC-type nitrate/sulfonate/bicarbonate transport system substrate-binding protein
MRHLTFSKLFSFIFLTTVLLLFSFPNQVQSEDLEITIGWQPDPNASMHVAKQKGYFEAVGLKPKFVKFLSGPPMFAALQSKSVDLCDFGLGPAVIGASQGIDFKVIAIVFEPSALNVLVVTPKSGIKTLSDIRGKKIASIRGSTPYYGLAKSLESVNLTFKDIEFVDMPAPNHIPAFKRGDIDGSFVWPPWQNKMVKLGGTRISSNAAVGAWAPDVWGARTEWIREKPEVVQRFLKAFFMGMKDLKRDPKVGAKALAQALELDTDIALEIVTDAGYPMPDELLNDNYMLSIEKGLVDAFRNGANFMYSEKLIRTLPKAEHFVDPGPVKAFVRSQK